MSGNHQRVFSCAKLFSDYYIRLMETRNEKAAREAHERITFNARTMWAIEHGFGESKAKKLATLSLEPADFVWAWHTAGEDETEFFLLLRRLILKIEGNRVGVRRV